MLTAALRSSFSLATFSPGGALPDSARVPLSHVTNIRGSSGGIGFGDDQRFVGKRPAFNFAPGE